MPSEREKTRENPYSAPESTASKVYPRRSAKFISSCVVWSVVYLIGFAVVENAIDNLTPVRSWIDDFDGLAWSAVVVTSYIVGWFATWKLLRLREAR